MMKYLDQLNGATLYTNFNLPSVVSNTYLNKKNNKSKR